MSGHILVVEHNALWEEGDYLIDVRRCPDCSGAGGIPLTTHKTFCGRCEGSGRIGFVRTSPEIERAALECAETVLA